MGKPKTLSKRAKRLAKKKGLVDTSSSNGSKFSIEDILEKAESFLEEYNYEMARKFVERALEMNSDHPKALETASSLLLEAGEAEKAQQCLGRAITVQPHEGHTKYFSLAQLLCGKDALDLYKKGLEVLQQQQNDLEAKPKETASAYCAMAELYMTDLCDEPEAESGCAEFIEKALEADQMSPEAWQTKARFLLVKSQVAEAKEAMSRSLELWLPDYLNVMENKPEAAAKFDPVEVCPLLYTTRLSTARILMEMEDWDTADQVLDGLAEEDDEVVDTWYLLGWLNRLKVMDLKEDVYNGNARFYLNKALEVHSKNPTQDLQMVQHAEELLQEIGPVVEGEEEVAEDWQDVSSDEEDMNT